MLRESLAALKPQKVNDLEADRDSNVEGIEAAGNHGPSADQNSTTKQHAIEVSQHTHSLIAVW